MNELINSSAVKNNQIAIILTSQHSKFTFPPHVNPLAECCDKVLFQLNTIDSSLFQHSKECSIFMFSSDQRFPTQSDRKLKLVVQKNEN